MISIRPRPDPGKLDVTFSSNIKPPTKDTPPPIKRHATKEELELPWIENPEIIDLKHH